MLIEIQQQDDICVLRMSGRLAVSADFWYLRQKADDVKSLNVSRVLADLREASFLDSTALGFLVSIYTSVTKNPGGRFVLAGPNDRVRSVLELTRLSTVIPIEDSLDAATARLRAQ